MNQNKFGFITLELSVALIITSIIILTMSNTKIISDVKVSNTKTQIIEILQQARTWALITGDKVIVCPMSKNKCSTNWHSTYIGAFSKNKQIAVIMPQQKNLLSWHANLNNTQNIIFRPDGRTQGEQGTLEIGNHYKVIINFNGNITLIS